MQRRRDATIAGENDGENDRTRENLIYWKIYALKFNKFGE